jgi:signal transduction histidine kinase
MINRYKMKRTEEINFFPSFKKKNMQELELEQENLYKNFNCLFLDYKEILYKYIDNFSNNNNMEYVIDKIRDRKIIELELKNQLKEDIRSYLKGFLEKDMVERRFYLKEFSIKLLTKYFNIYPEEEILRIIFNDFFKFILAQKDEEKAIKILSKILKDFFILEIRIIALNLRDFVPKQENIKMNELIENSIHIIMSSSSDILGNHLNLIEQKAYLYRKLLTLFEKVDEEKKNKSKLIINTINELGSPLEKLIEFSSIQSSLFNSFKNESKSNCTSLLLENIFQIVFKNGFKVKHNSVNINIENTLECVYFSLNEYIMVNSIYAILENALEAKAANITIKIYENTDIYIDFKNDGEKIKDKFVPFLFDKFFTSKKDHYGMGLFIAKQWLENISCTLKYIEDGNIFRVTIPIQKKEKIFI